MTKVMVHRFLRMTCLLSGLIISHGVSAQNQEVLHITYIDEDTMSFSSTFKLLVTEEINALLSSRVEVTYTSLFTSTSLKDINGHIDKAFKDENTDVIIGMGLMSSMMIAQKKVYPKPTIAGIIIDREIHHLAKTQKGGSGVNNFSYIQTPFDISKDLHQLYDIAKFEKVGIFYDGGADGTTFLLDSFFYSRLPNGASAEFLPMRSSPQETVNSIPTDIDAVYILTISRFNEDELRTFFNLLSEKGLPSFALTGRNYVELGAMAGLAPTSFLPNLARRLALDILSISEGVNASELPVQIQKQDPEFVINMECISKLNIYPDFDILNRAILLNLAETSSDINWSIESIIYEAIKNNLDLSATYKNIDLAKEDVNIAKATLYPQLDVSSSGAWIDPTRVDNSNGQAASISWTANASLNQLIYSEPALANVAIQKLIQETEDAAYQQTQLDLILEVSQAFLTFLQSKSFVTIRSENVEVTNQNLGISRSKERLGYSGISDVYRFESELAENIIDLNDAFSNMRQARINMNRIINRPQAEEFTTTDITNQNLFSMASESRISEVITNRLILDRLTDFLIKEAFANLPQLKQIELTIQAQQRLLKSNERKFYLPDIGLKASWDQAINYFGENTPPAGFNGLSRKPELTIGASVKLPLLTGGERKAEVQKSKITISQLAEQEQDLKNALEASLRSNMEILSSSFQRVDLSERSRIAAKKNFEIIQDLYRQGEVDIVTLIDAQNSSLFSELNATNSIYQFISDFLAVERLTGKYYFMLNPGEQEAFFTRLSDYVLRK